MESTEFTVSCAFRSAVLDPKAPGGSLQHLLCLWPVKNQPEHPRDGHQLRDRLHRATAAELSEFVSAPTRFGGHLYIFPGWPGADVSLRAVARLSKLLQGLQSHHIHSSKKWVFIS